MALRGICLLIVGIGVLFANSASAQQYTVTDILGGRPYGRAHAISARGDVVGEWGFQNAFIWSNGSTQDLGHLEGTTSCVATALNDIGQVVGTCWGPGGQHAFLWTADNGMTALPTADPSGALGINSQGHIVGSQGDPARAFLYHDGVLDALGSGHALGINDQGQVVGYDGNSPTNYIALLWDDTGRHELDNEGGAAIAYAIRADGVVAGRSTRGGKPDRFHAVLWTPYGISDLGTLGGDWSEALAINGDLIVGNSACNPPCAGTTTHAFLYDNQGGPGYALDLNDLIPQSSPPWRLISATGINEARQIVGYADRGGELNAFLLTPVQLPATSR